MGFTLRKTMGPVHFPLGAERQCSNANTEQEQRTRLSCTNGHGRNVNRRSLDGFDRDAGHFDEER